MRSTLFSLIVLGVVGLASSAARAVGPGQVTIWVNDQVNGWQEIASGPVMASASAYTTPNLKFTMLTVSASATNGPSGELSSSAFEIEHDSSGVDIVQIAVIGMDFTSPTLAPITVSSQVSGGNEANNQGLLTSLSFQSYVDPTDNGMPALLAGGLGLEIPTVLSPSIGGAGAILGNTISSNLSSPFSVGELFTLSMTGAGQITNLDGDTKLSAAVPEPGAAALLGLGCLLAMRRR